MSKKIVVDVSKLPKESFQGIEFDHVCQIVRPSDLMNLVLYFFNVTLIDNKRLIKKEPDYDSYMVVRIPQQHLGEQVLQCIPKSPYTPSKIFSSGFSFLTFKICKDLSSQSLLDYNETSLLDWRNPKKFKLIHTPSLRNFPKYQIAELKRFYDEHESSYPFNVSSNPYDHPFLFKSNSGRRIPVTLFELPYKMYLSPIDPFPSANWEDKDHWSFTRNNQKVLLLDELSQDSSNTRVEVYEIWNNNLVYKVKNQNGPFYKSFPPSFKILGYANNDREPISDEESKISDQGVQLLPSSSTGDQQRNDRRNLALLSRALKENEENKHIRDYERDIRSDYLNISGLGSSTFLRYDHPEPEVEITDNTLENLRIVGWKQEVKLGRDNYVEIVERAIDTCSGLKILFVDIAERQIIGKKSFLKRRYEFRYIETEKSYDTPEFRYKTPFKHIRALEKGAYFSPFYFDAPGDVRPIAVCKELDGTNPECDEETHIEGIYPSGLLKFRYAVTDWNDQIHEIEMDVLFVRESDWSITHNLTSLALIAINDNKVKNRSFHIIKYKNKFAFANSISLTEVSSNIAKNVELEAKEMFLFAHFSNAHFDSEYPMAPLLLYLKGAIPQLDGLESKTSLHLMTYAITYKTCGFDNNNISKVFLKRLRSDFLDNLIDVYWPEVDKLLKENEQPFTNYMSKDHTSFGPLGNTNSPCEGIFLNDQGLTLSEDLANRKENTGVSDEKRLETFSFSPTDFLGVNVELLGGVKLKDILEEALDLQDLPIMKVYEDVKNEIEWVEETLKGYKDIYDCYKEKFETLKQTVKEFPSALRVLEKALVAEVKTEIQETADRWIEKQVDYYVNLILKEYYQNSDIREFVHEVQKYTQLVERLKGRVNTLQTIWQQGIADIKIDIENLSNDPEEDLSRYYDSKEKVERFLKSLLAEIRKLSNEVGVNKNISSDIGLKEVAYVFIKHYLYQLIRENDKIDLKVFITVLKDFKKHTKNKKVINELIAQINEVVRYSPAYFNSLNSTLEQEAKIRTIRAEQMLNDEIKKLILNNIQPIASLYEIVLVYKNKYQAFQDRRKTFELLAEEFKFSLKKQDQTEIEYLQYLNETLPDVTEKAVIELQKIVEEISWDQWASQLAEGTDWEVLKEFYEKIKVIDPKDEEAIKKLEAIAKELKVTLESLYIELKEKYDKKRLEIEGQINKLKKQYQWAKTSIDNAPKFLLEELKKKLDNLAPDEIEKYERTKAIIKAIEGPKKKRIDYRWSTQKFKSSSQGMVRFIKEHHPPTSFSIDFQSTTHFDISLDSPPRITKNEFGLVNRFSNFGLGLGPILVNFEELRYASGSSSNTDFSVKIRDVQFEGPLNFIKAFQNYLQTLNKYLILYLDGNGATLGYSLPLPNLLFGYLNFFQLKLSMAITLPFLPKTPTVLKVGINNPNDRFLVSVNGFMGTGYFEVVMNPKIGLVSITFLVEFEAKFYLRMPGAKGGAHLFAGFYFRKLQDRVELKGMLHLSGHLNVANLFNASVTFDMVLLGNGNYLKGYSNLKVSYRFSRWFKVSVRLRYYKKFYGTGSAQSGYNKMIQGFGLLNNGLQTRSDVAELHGFSVIDSNFYNENDNYFARDIMRPWLIVKIPKEKKYKLSIQYSNGHKDEHNLNYVNTFGIYRDSNFNYVKIEKWISKTNTEFNIYIETGGRSVPISLNNYYARKYNEHEYQLPDGTLASENIEHYLSYL